MSSHGHFFSPATARKQERGQKTYKLLVMHQDGLFTGVDVELDNVAVTTAIQ